jgi:hypothetical protein
MNDEWKRIPEILLDDTTRKHADEVANRYSPPTPDASQPAAASHAADH